MEQKDIRISVVNFNATWGDKAANITKMKTYITEAARDKVEMLIFPEMALIGYDNEEDKEKAQKMHTLNAETIPGKTTNEFSELAKKHNMYIIFGMAQKKSEDSDICYNAAAICAPDGRTLSYQKIHLPMDESKWAVCGETPMVFDTKWGKVGLSICYDTFCYPELIRYARGMGARLYINCAACNEGVNSVDALQLQLESYSVTNAIYIATANLCGKDKESNFIGGSSVMGAREDSYKEAKYYAGYPFNDKKSHRNDLHTATIDLEFIDTRTVLPIFTKNDRLGRPDFKPLIYAKAYQDLANSKEWKSMID